MRRTFTTMCTICVLFSDSFIWFGELKEIMCGQTDPKHRICAYDTGFRSKMEDIEPKADTSEKAYKYD